MSKIWTSRGKIWAITHFVTPFTHVFRHFRVKIIQKKIFRENVASDLSYKK